MLQAEGVLLRKKQEGKQSTQAAPKAQPPAEVVGADNAGQLVMVKPHSRKRQAEASSGGQVAALDTQQAGQQQAVAEGRGQPGQEEQGGELTLEQRVNALQLQQQPPPGVLPRPSPGQPGHCCCLP